MEYRKMAAAAKTDEQRAAARKWLADELRKLTEKELADEEAKNKTLTENTKKAREEIADIMKGDKESNPMERASKEIEANRLRLLSYAKTQEEIDAINADAKAKQEALIEAQIETLKEMAWNALSSMANSVKSILGDLAEAAMAAVDEETQAQLEAAGLAEETQKQQLERELAAAIAAGDAETAAEKKAELERVKIIEAGEKKKAQIKYDSELASWGISLAMGIAEAARATISSMTGLAFPFNIVAAGSTGAAGALQVGAIAASKPAPPKLWTGTANPVTGGSYIVGDQGPEMVNLPTGSTVANNRDTMAALAQPAQSMLVQLIVDGRKFAENTVNYINNGTVRLELA
jgi:hypothetical protein